MNCITEIAEAVAKGAHQKKACEVIGITERTLQRWKNQPEKKRYEKGAKDKAEK